MKIAFASDDQQEIGAHFGLAKNFVVYEVSADGYEFFESVAVKSEGDEEDDKIQERLDALTGCAIVYCTHIGGVAAARLVKNKIHPIKVGAGCLIEEELDRLKNRLSHNPPMWLRRVKGVG